MKKMRFFVLAVMVMFAVLAVGLIGCATPPKKGIWQGDWNWSHLKWAAETRLDGDVPRTMIKNDQGTIFIFQ
jgi:hypothetical protein